MEQTSVRLFLALFLTIWGLGTLKNAGHLRKVVDDAVAHPAIQSIFALIPLILGSFLVATHNIWVWNFKVLVTIIGWLMLTGGAFRTIFVEQFAKLMSQIKGLMIIRISGAITTLLGLTLIFAELF